MRRIISIINHKGGVGKTCCCVHVGAGLAKSGRKVLLVDLDKQRNLTQSFFGDSLQNEQGIADAILNRREINLSSIARTTTIDGLFVIPATNSLQGLESSLFNEIGREYFLKEALSVPFIEQFDYVILDNSPHAGLISVNSLVASEYFLVPIATEYFSLTGIKSIFETIQKIRRLNPELKNLGLLLSMVDKREGISKDTMKILNDNFRMEIFNNFIRINTHFKSCPSQRKTIFDIESASGKGYTDYMNVTQEIEQRLQQWH
ncbi:MAG: ParA family protein [Oligoflexia bacterium]|nr:ParA family protein [Oligoflexia bacterium]